jgi:hypothetical protein
VRAREAIENLVRCEDLHLTVADQRVHRCVTEVGAQGHVAHTGLKRGEGLDDARTLACAVKDRSWLSL